MHRWDSNPTEEERQKEEGIKKQKQTVQEEEKQTRGEVNLI
jgi:hypothetical protein